ncbi:hypothetical protein OXX69_000927 [Metschnikowia pulcherrima]
MTIEVWPEFKAQRVSHSLPESQDLPCPYILSRKVLGTGSYANVYECKHKVTGAHYAAKRFTKKLIYGNESMLQREFQVLKRISRGHPNILSMIDYFETSDYFYLVTDLAAGGELFERITKAPEAKLSITETSKILSVLLSALQHLHSNGIVHRDVKAENILFASKSSKISSLLLADFGQARILKPGELAQIVDGTLSYLAPEVLSKCGHSFPVDMWAVGVLTYFMLSGYMPFDCDTDTETKELITKADFVFEPTEYWDHIPAEAKDFIASCFKLDPQERITARAALEHPFLHLKRPAIKPAFSFNSLQQLQDAVSKLQHSRQVQSPNGLSRQNSASYLLAKQTSSSNLALRHRIQPGSHLTSAKCSFEDLKQALQGEKCHSPEIVTNFHTPITSASNSQQSSMLGMDSVMKELGSPGKAGCNATKVGRAEFTL